METMQRARATVFSPCMGGFCLASSTSTILILVPHLSGLATHSDFYSDAATDAARVWQRL